MNEDVNIGIDSSSEIFDFTSGVLKFKSTVCDAGLAVGNYPVTIHATQANNPWRFASQGILIKVKDPNLPDLEDLFIPPDDTKQYRVSTYAPAFVKDEVRCLIYYVLN